MDVLSFTTLLITELTVLDTKQICIISAVVKSHLSNIRLPALILLGFAIVFI